MAPYQVFLRLKMSLESGVKDGDEELGWCWDSFQVNGPKSSYSQSMGSVTYYQHFVEVLNIGVGSTEGAEGLRTCLRTL